MKLLISIACVLCVSCSMAADVRIVVGEPADARHTMRAIEEMPDNPGKMKADMITKIQAQLESKLSHIRDLGDDPTLAQIAVGIHSIRAGEIDSLTWIDTSGAITFSSKANCEVQFASKLEQMIGETLVMTKVKIDKQCRAQVGMIKALAYPVGE